MSRDEPRVAIGRRDDGGGGRAPGRMSGKGDSRVSVRGDTRSPRRGLGTNPSRAARPSLASALRLRRRRRHARPAAPAVTRGASTTTAINPGCASTTRGDDRSRAARGAARRKSSGQRRAVLFFTTRFVFSDVAPRGSLEPVPRPFERLELGRVLLLLLLRLLLRLRLLLCLSRPPSLPPKTSAPAFLLGSPLDFFSSTFFPSAPSFGPRMKFSNSLLSFSDVVGTSTSTGFRSARVLFPSRRLPPPANARNFGPSSARFFSPSPPSVASDAADGLRTHNGLPIRTRPGCRRRRSSRPGRSRAPSPAPTAGEAPPLAPPSGAGST